MQNICDLVSTFIRKGRNGSNPIRKPKPVARKSHKIYSCRLLSLSLIVVVVVVVAVASRCSSPLSTTPNVVRCHFSVARVSPVPFHFRRRFSHNRVCRKGAQLGARWTSRLHFPHPHTLYLSLLSRLHHRREWRTRCHPRRWPQRRAGKAAMGATVDTAVVINSLCLCCCPRSLHHLLMSPHHHPPRSMFVPNHLLC